MIHMVGPYGLGLPSHGVGGPAFLVLLVKPGNPVVPSLNVSV